MFSLCDARVDDLLDGYLLDAARGFYFFAVFADRVGDDGLGAVFVLGDLLLGEGDGVVVFFFRPVGAAAGVLVMAGDEKESTCPAGRDMFAVVMWCDVMCGKCSDLW